MRLHVGCMCGTSTHHELGRARMRLLAQGVPFTDAWAERCKEYGWAELQAWWQAQPGLHTREVFGLLAAVLSGEHGGSKEPSADSVLKVVQVRGRAVCLRWVVKVRARSQGIAGGEACGVMQGYSKTCPHSHTHTQHTHTLTHLHVKTRHVHTCARTHAGHSHMTCTRALLALFKPAELPGHARVHRRELRGCIRARRPGADAVAGHAGLRASTRDVPGAAHRAGAGVFGAGGALL